MRIAGLTPFFARSQKLGGKGGEAVRKCARFDLLALKIIKDTNETTTTSNTMPTRNASTSDSVVLSSDSCMKRIGQQNIQSANMPVGVPGNKIFTINKTVNMRPTTITPVAKEARKSFMSRIVA